MVYHSMRSIEGGSNQTIVNGTLKKINVSFQKQPGNMVTWATLFAKQRKKCTSRQIVKWLDLQLPKNGEICYQNRKNKIFVMWDNSTSNWLVIVADLTLLRQGWDVLDWILIILCKCCNKL